MLPPVHEDDDYNEAEVLAALHEAVDPLSASNPSAQAALSKAIKAARRGSLSKIQSLEVAIRQAAGSLAITDRDAAETLFGLAEILDYAMEKGANLRAQSRAARSLCIGACACRTWSNAAA